MQACTQFKPKLSLSTDRISNQSTTHSPGGLAALMNLEETQKPQPREPTHPAVHFLPLFNNSPEVRQDSQGVASVPRVLRELGRAAAPHGRRLFSGSSAQNNSPTRNNKRGQKRQQLTVETQTRKAFKFPTTLAQIMSSLLRQQKTFFLSKDDF